MKNFTETNTKFNSLIILGPTACGKTLLAVKIADTLIQNGKMCHIVSADSRQVYRNLDIGSGKDLADFTLDKGTKNERAIPYDLIDIVDVTEEYNVYRYQKDFYEVFKKLIQQNIFPIIVGGTGMYLDAIIRDYKMGDVGTNVELRKELQGKSNEDLAEILVNLKKQNGKTVHNTTDTLEHHRLLRAIEIETWEIEQSKKNYDKTLYKNQDFKQNDINRVSPLILGTTFERSVLRQRITDRLKSRLQNGMIEEVKNLHKNGVSYERLERLGLEYKFVSLFLQGKISETELFVQLNTAIHQFAKRQETWFRGMERKGIAIHWLTKDIDETQENSRIDKRFIEAIALLKENGLDKG